MSSITHRILMIGLAASACAKTRPVAAVAPSPAVPPPPLATTASNYDAVRNGFWLPNECVWATSSPVPERRRHIAAPGGELTGIVTTDSKTPAWGAYIELDTSMKQTAGTDQKGTYVIHHVTTGEHAIRVRALGYLAANDTIVVDPQGDLTLNYELKMDPPEKMAQCWHFEPVRKPALD
jgi:hypothetical protein